jgi:hypothetical protein
MPTAPYPTPRGSRSISSRDAPYILRPVDTLPAAGPPRSLPPPRCSPPPPAAHRAHLLRPPPHRPPRSPLAPPCSAPPPPAPPRSLMRHGAPSCIRWRRGAGGCRRCVAPWLAGGGRRGARVLIVGHPGRHAATAWKRRSRARGRRRRMEQERRRRLGDPARHREGRGRRRGRGRGKEEALDPSVPILRRRPVLRRRRQRRCLDRGCICARG